MRAATLMFTLLAAPAFAQDATITPDNTLATPPTGWIGDQPHLVIMGTVGGRPVDMQYLEMATAQGIDTFEGKREYLPGDAGVWRYADFEVAISAAIEGVEKSFELEFENFDFRQHTLPATFELQGINFPEGALGFLELQAEWETEGGTVNDELGGWTGTLTLSLDQGTPDAEGLVPDGLIGGFVVAGNGTDAVVISFTVPVVEYEKDE